MVALARDILTNEPKAILRTALTHDGCKAEVDGRDQLALGTTKGGAIKLTPDEDVTTCLGVGEGLETTLSLQTRREFGRSPVWCLLSAGGIEAFLPLPGIEVLWIAVDHDKNGRCQKAARAAARRWQAAGAEVLLVTPTLPGCDLNDLVHGG
jgi:hypothetical protein